MEFFEAPVTSDFEARGDPAAETYTPPHLRIEDPCLNEHARQLLHKCLQRMHEDGAPVRTLVFVTSNSAGWGAPEDPLRERLKNLTSLVREVADRWRLPLEPATMLSVHQYADSVWPRSEPAEADEAG